MSTIARSMQRELVRNMTAEEKLRASEALRATAWDLKAAWIRTLHPDLDETAVQESVRKVFRDARY